MAPTAPNSSRNNGTRSISSRALGSKPIQPNSFNSGGFNSIVPKPSFGTSSMSPPIQPSYTGGFAPPPQAAPSQFTTPNYTGGFSQPPQSVQSQSSVPNYTSNVTMQPLKPNFSGSYSPKPPQAPYNNAASPNYNVSLPSMTPMAAPATQSMSPPPFFNAGMGVLAPSKPQQPTWGNSTNQPSKDIWGDFDPLG